MFCEYVDKVFSKNVTVEPSQTVSNASTPAIPGPHAALIMILGRSRPEKVESHRANASLCWQKRDMAPEAPYGQAA